MRINIAQITNYDLENVSEEKLKTVHIGGDKGSNREVIYKVLPAVYLHFPIHKIGYCCESRAIQYPIFINEKEFQIGKTGMFEIQPEELKILNSSETEPIEVNINSIWVPWYDNSIKEPESNGFKFTFDFMYETN